MSVVSADMPHTHIVAFDVIYTHTFYAVSANGNQVTRKAVMSHSRVSFQAYTRMPIKTYTRMPI